MCIWFFNIGTIFFVDPEGNSKEIGMGNENQLLLPSPQPNWNPVPITPAKQMKLLSASVSASTPAKTSKVLGNFF